MFVGFQSALEEEKADDIRTRTKSKYNFRDTDKQTVIAKKILDMKPPSLGAAISVSEELPDWSLEHWTPIQISSNSVTLCKLNFEQYYNTPHIYPMFKDLVAASNCKDSNLKYDSLTNILADIAAKQGTPEGRVVPPTGFIFHESRVGSTLVANLLASNPWAMVNSSHSTIPKFYSHSRLHCPMF
jgi:hypothetical protein